MTLHFDFCAEWMNRSELCERVRWDRHCTAYRVGPFAVVVTK